MRNKFYKFLVIGVTVLGMTAFLAPSAIAAEIDVYLEGAYDDTYLDVYIYADINFTDNALISYGVRLEYFTSELTFDSAVKNVELTDRDWTYTSNPTKWQLGNGANQDNPDPVDSESVTTGTRMVVFKGGILNEASPTEGVPVTALARVFLGTVRFTAGTGGSIPASPDLALTYAEDFSTDPDSYKNFVAYVDGATPSGQVIDTDYPDDPSGVDFSSIIIYKRGDANADGVVNSVDYIQVRNLRNSPDAPVYVDCNDDGVVNSVDYICVRNNRD